MILICSTPTTPTVGFMACVRACLEMCVCVCVCFALVCCALRVDFIKSLRLTNTVIIIIIIRESFQNLYTCKATQHRHVPITMGNLCS